MTPGPPNRPLVFISGLGPVTSLGLGIEELEEAIGQRAALEGVRADAGDASRPGLIPDFDLEEILDTSRRYGDRRLRCALAAGTLALDNAYVLEDEMAPERCGLALASALGDPVREPVFVHRASSARVRLPGEASAERVQSPEEALAAELLLRGLTWSAFGDLLCGAQALEVAWSALSDGKADLMLSGGVDVVGESQLRRLAEQTATQARPGQGAALLVLETGGELERREGFAFCELGAVVCRAPQDGSGPAGLREALRAAVDEAIAASGIWEGDVGVIFLCSGAAFSPAAAEAEASLLEAFSQVPVTSAKHFVGETFGAGFPMECIMAAQVLNTGELPPRVVMVGQRRGVEFWVRHEQQELLGFAALVVGCTDELAAAAVLKSL